MSTRTDVNPVSSPGNELFEQSCAADILRAKVQGRHTTRPLRVMEASESGRPADGKPFMSGDQFLTVSGRPTTPWPRTDSQLEVDRWLATNAAAEADRNGDWFNSRRFEQMRDGLARPNKRERTMLSQCDRDYLNLYLWLIQPSPPPRLLKRGANPVLTRGC